jgi:hypothetical protein
MHRFLPLNIDELEFIQRRYRSESKIYMRAMNVLLVLGTLAPLAFCIFLIFSRPSKELSMSVLYNVFFVGFIFMMLFVGFIAFVSYRVKLLAYHRDKIKKQKVVELTNIKQKKYMKLNDTYHFYLNSPTKYTIEVSPADFEKYQLGDEISIEYAQYSKEYFGYY